MRPYLEIEIESFKKRNELQFQNFKLGLETQLNGINLVCMKPLVQTPHPHPLALQKRWERNEKQSKGNEDACPLDTQHL